MRTSESRAVDIVILGDAESRFCLDLQVTARQHGHLCDIRPFQRTYTHLVNQAANLHSSEQASINFNAGQQDEIRPLDTYQACLTRSMPSGSLEQVIFRMDLLWSLEQAGVLMVNSPKAMECAIDKYLTLARCRGSGLPIPETVCCETAEQAWECFCRWGKKAVLKPIFGSEGRGICLLTEPETAGRAFRTLEQMRAVIYLQRFLENGGQDMRVMLIGGQAIGAIRRQATGDFRANCAQSGVAKPHQLTNTERELAESAGKAVGAVFAGVDLIYDEYQNLYVLEVNACPGWQAFQRVTGIAVPDLLIDWIAETCRLRENSDIVNAIR